MEIDWGFYIDLAQIITLILGVLAILAAIIKDYYASKGNTKLLLKDHGIIIDKANSISSDVKSQTSELRNTVIRSTDQITHKTDNIQNSINAIDKHLAVEAVRRDNMEKNLTKDQLDTTRQIQAINYINDQMALLQSRVVQLTNENQALKEENWHLQEQINNLQHEQKREHRHSHDYDMEM